MSLDLIKDLTTSLSSSGDIWRYTSTNITSSFPLPLHSSHPSFLPAQFLPLSSPINFSSGLAVAGQSGVDGQYIHAPSADEIRTAVLASFFITFLFGSAGNLLVVFVIGTHPEIRVKSVSNYYIWNLAFADLLFVCTLPFFCYATYKIDWPFGVVACKLSYAVRECNKLVSVFTLVALSFDRYLASFYNTNHWRTITIGKITCAFIWCIFLVMTTPYWLYAKTVVYGSANLTSCRMYWPTENKIVLIKTWSYVQLLVGFVGPFIAILGAYLALGVRLQRLLASGSRSAVKRTGITMTRTTVVVAVTFLVTQLPYHVLEIMNVSKMESILSANNSTRWSTASSSFKGGGMEPSNGGGITGVTGGAVDGFVVVRSLPSPAPPGEMRMFVVMGAIAKILVFVSSCANPIIYGLLNQNYRKLYMDTLCSCCPNFLAKRKGAAGRTTTREGGISLGNSSDTAGGGDDKEGEETGEKLSGVRGASSSRRSSRRRKLNPETTGMTSAAGVTYDTGRSDMMELIVTHVPP